MAEPPLIVDKWKEWQAARRWAKRAKKCRTEEERQRCWRQVMTHLRAAMTGQLPDDQPGQLRLLDE